MDPRKLIVALVAAIVAGGLVWWSTAVKKEAGEKAPGSSPTQVLQVDTQKLRKIELVRRDAEKTVLESGDGKTWRLTSPIEAPVDSEASSSLLASLATVSADEIVEEKAADFAPYGLAQPYLSATFKLQDGKQHVLLLGDEAPVGSGTYARVDNGPRLLLIGNFTKTAIDKFAADLRDRRLVNLAADKLQRVTLKSKSGEVEFEKAGADWRIMRPSPMRADGWAVEEAIRKLREARFDATLTSDDLKSIAQAYASAQPLVTATFSDGAATQVLEVRKNSSTNKFYVKSPLVDGPQLLAGEPLDGLDKPAADYRSKKLFDFGFSEPEKIVFKGAEKEFTLNKSGEKWVSGGKAMDNVGVQSLVDRLRDLSATSFPTGAFPTPSIELTVVSGEGKRVEKIALGMTAASRWYARREGEPALYEVAAEAVSQLVKTAGDVREAPAAQASKGAPAPKAGK